jgi:hypothetical protein
LRYRAECGLLNGQRHQAEEDTMSVASHLATFTAGNSGRRFRALVTATRRVRIEVQSPQGRTLPTVGETFTPEQARELGKALILAANSADLARVLAEGSSDPRAVTPVELDR